jgi:hypothetical protein
VKRAGPKRDADAEAGAGPRTGAWTETGTETRAYVGLELGLGHRRLPYAMVSAQGNYRGGQGCADEQKAITKEGTSRKALRVRVSKSHTLPFSSVALTQR